jgi:hypothetical protein
MADALIGITETQAAAKTEISNVAQMYLKQASILMPTVVDYSYLAGPGVKAVNVPRSGGFTVGSKSENTAIEAQIITYAADSIALTYHRAVQFLAEDIATVQSVIGIQDAIMKATKDLAYDIDAAIFAALLAGPSTSAPDHSVVFADTSGDVVAKADILAARKLLRTQNIDPRECFILIGPEKEAELLALADFIQAERYGSNAPIMNGEFGTIFGMKVLVHSVVTDQMITYHKSALGFALQQGITYASQSDLANLGMRHSLSYLAGFKVMDSGKRHVLTDSTNA